MPLTIIKASEPIEVKRITVTIYAQPGLGRTSTGYTSGGLLLDFDHGSYRSAFRRDTVLIDSWQDVADITPEDMQPYPAIVVDTAGRALDFLTADIIRRDSKMARGSGDLTLPGFGQLKARFATWLKHLHALGKDVVLLAHMDEQRKGDEIIERLDIQGSSRQEIYKVSDAMARLYFENGRRKLNFNPGDTAFGKNPAMLPVYDVPDFTREPDWLAGVITTIKAKLNEGSEAMRAETQRLANLAENFAALVTVEEFNTLAAALAGAEPKVKALLVQAAERRGLALDRQAKPARFVEKGGGVQHAAVEDRTLPAEGAPAVVTGGSHAPAPDLNTVPVAASAPNGGAAPPAGATVTGESPTELEEQLEQSLDIVQAQKLTDARRRWFAMATHAHKAGLTGFTKLVLGTGAEASQARRRLIAKLIGQRLAGSKTTAQEYTDAADEILVRINEAMGLGVK